MLGWTGAADQSISRDGLEYRVGVDLVQEAVISSHFMHRLAQNTDLKLYDEDQFAARAIDIDAGAVHDRLIPELLRACTAFARARAVAAKSRARENYRKYGLGDPGQTGAAQFITEVMFDRQYLRGPRETCSREVLCAKVREQMQAGSPIDMVIPALPFKFFSPLKTRGRRPDLAELNFILGLYEIAATIDLIYREARPDVTSRLAGFTVVSDGSRFNELVNEPAGAIAHYRHHVALWIRRLRLEDCITLVDYGALLRDRLPVGTWEAKATIASRARSEYSDTLWPIFDPYGTAAMLSTAATVEPDPESSNPEGRFVSLLKSLVYTIDYRALDRHKHLPAGQFHALYRDLTGHIFEPYAVLSPAELRTAKTTAEAAAETAPTDRVKEYLRQSMLREAWSSAIDYMAEIKSDRELAEDPILTCLPGHFRWTIHAKSGQLALLTPTASGTPVQAWAGAGVFRLTKTGKIKLCTLPVLALEGVGATPVRVSGVDDGLDLGEQPLFYIYPDIEFANLDDFLSRLARLLVRKRTS